MSDCKRVKAIHKHVQITFTVRRSQSSLTHILDIVTQVMNNGTVHLLKSARLSAAQSWHAQPRLLQSLPPWP